MPLSCLLAAAVLFQAPQVTFTEDKIGEGSEAKLGDIVTINYVGRALNGQIFDSTRLTAPFAFPLGSRDLIQGYARLPFISFDKAIVGMKQGGRRTITIPGELAFGELAVGEYPANTKFTFEVELFDVRKKDSEPKLKIEDLKPGIGEEAKTGYTVEVHYRGTFLNGRPFDSSYGRKLEDGSEQDIPITAVIGGRGLIKGFSEGLAGMKIGGKRRVTIPYDLAYGKEGRPPAIPAYSTLVFELDLMQILKKPGGAE